VLACALVACSQPAPTIAPSNVAAPTEAPPPATDVVAIASISPVRGDDQGGTYVVIRGSRFISEGPRRARVYFGSTLGAVIRFQSDRELIVQAPPGRAGDVVDVRVVFDPGGERVLPKAFTYVTLSNGP